MVPVRSECGGHTPATNNRSRGWGFYGRRDVRRLCAPLPPRIPRRLGRVVGEGNAKQVG